MGGRGPKRKGDQFEREIRDLMRETADPDAEKMPLSGALGGKWHGDVRAQIAGRSMAIQCKRRKRVPDWISLELADHDIKAIRGDRGKTVLMMNEDVWRELWQWIRGAI